MVKVETVDYSQLRVRDLTHLPAKRLRIRGSYAYLTSNSREMYGATEYLLIREPRNRHDASAIAIYGRQRKVGYVSAAKAASMAPLLDEFTDCDGFVVKGASTSDTSIRLWVDLPSLPELRAYVKRNT
ncbi:hypothetical protein IT072_13965 [Leifsonia sp. ZF2019]|uniref:HIRAN domain-containing protein n=1 Tax=Leifsonia sp. ZF2019 TaxID=2781978 RepID=UPI001CC17B49|nr:HIRAN domain-containing protein [Leifsonia sp. ZF2019]UAJ78364.1 hypothetical protein IT072_13965 [Leifsonia sp. ZF2019]